MREDESDDEAIEAEGFREDEDEDHPHEELLLLPNGSYAGVAHYPDRHARRKAAVFVDRVVCVRRGREGTAAAAEKRRTSRKLS